MLNNEDRSRLLDFLEKRFGMNASEFNAWQVYAFKRQAFLFRAQHAGTLFREDSFVRCGLPFMRIVAGYLKPTTVFVQKFGAMASRNRIDLPLEKIAELCSEGELPTGKSAAECHEDKTPGYVIVRTRNLDIGVGLLMNDGRLLCRFPKAIRQALSLISAL